MFIAFWPIKKNDSAGHPSCNTRDTHLTSGYEVKIIPALASSHTPCQSNYIIPGYPHNDSIAILQHVIPVHGFADSPV
jgi:hypothetical protein